MSLPAPRRFLPSLPLLAAFEAAARTGSITEAAAELSLTQSAVSRQIRALEGQLGVDLFRREKQKIRLTPGGETYAREIRDALTRISDASLQLLASPGGGTLTLAVPPTFGARWLIPRLARFHAAHRDVSINILSRLGRFDFRQDVADAAIFFGQPDWGGAGLLHLMGERMLPVCAPGLKAEYGFARAGDIRLAPLLHLTTRPDAWETWLRAQGADHRGVQGMLLDQFAALAEAAVAGFGVALLPEILIARELAEGRLVAALDLPVESAGAYHLAWPADRPDYPPLMRFRSWLLSEIAAEITDPSPV
ncbi:LysR substrate-binding domain-containing protein [Pseudogemmobacter bohemicus]|uniref:LysR substrate-binding domain-containing protein n=1 Tax=Pseudogemmobacter bohemicus TaxID=2250708 RepID=UPI001E390E7F|nr:LysR substrate-binding domain-containing protein [Pseudogemmobacter bohemicus]